MKKFLKRFLAATAAMSIMLVSSTANIFAAGKPRGDEYELNGLDPSNAKNKPTITISKEVISNNEAKTNPKRRVTVSIKNADSAYANAGFTIRFDERLTLVKHKDFIAFAEDAWEYCQPVFVPDTEHGFRVILASSENCGQDGIMFSFDLQLPEDLDNKGGKYPIELYYNKDTDLFTNANMDEEGQLMEAWLFTQGIEHGYIEVQPKWTDPTTTAPQTTVTTTFTTVTTTVQTPVKPETDLGDANNDGRIDSVDASEILRLFAYLSTGGASTENDKKICDINNDGRIDSVDASAVLAYYALISSSEPEISFTEYLKKKGIRK